MKRLNGRSPEEEIDRLTAIIDGASDGLITIDSQGQIETFNPACERIFGYSADEIIGKNVKILFPETDRVRYETYKRECPKNNVKGREIGGLHKDGTALVLQFSLNLFRLKDSQHYCSVIRDITAQKNAEQQGQQVMEKLIQSNAELERFAYVASHDMQEPMRMIMNFGKILASEYGDGLDEQGRECLRFVTESIERIHQMIDDLLDCARIGHEDQCAIDVDTACELQHVLGNLNGLITESGAQITSDPMPHIQGNPVQIMRLMQNLITNAIKYQSQGNIPKVHVGVEDVGLCWRISVKDNGIGIDEAFTEQIFQPFRRLHSWEETKGTGIGLAVCRKIVENHGGKIGVTSVPGVGSTFIFDLPKSADKQQAA